MSRKKIEQSASCVTCFVFVTLNEAANSWHLSEKEDFSKNSWHTAMSRMEHVTRIVTSFNSWHWKFREKTAFVRDTLFEMEKKDITKFLWCHEISLMMSRNSYVLSWIICVMTWVDFHVTKNKKHCHESSFDVCHDIPRKYVCHSLG